MEDLGVSLTLQVEEQVDLTTLHHPYTEEVAIFAKQMERLESIGAKVDFLDFIVAINMRWMW